MKRKKMLLVISVMLTFFICSGMIIGYFQTNRAEAAEVIAWGSSGSKVSEIQRLLKQWGYFDGSITGYFAKETYNAVVKFQKKHGLKADGVVGPETAAALGISLGKGGAAGAPAQGGGGNQNDVYLLARAVYGEARGEPYVGQVAIAAVILNRVRDSRFPNTIAGVIYQPRAFTAVDDGQINLTPDDTAIKAARDALNGWDPTYGAIYYYNPATATSKWIFSRPVHLRIGKHVFAT